MATVGLMGIGLNTYWGQFEGLLEKLQAYQAEIADRITEMGVTVADAGMVDHPVKAADAAVFFGQKNIDLLFIYVSTYALSSTVLPVARQVKVPVVILNLQPVAQLDYKSFNALGDRGKMTGIWLVHCQACSVPELASVFNRSGIPYELVTGYLHEEESWNEI